MFIYTDRRALSAHLLATLVVQCASKWMHKHNENKPNPTLSRTRSAQYTQIVTVSCVKSNGGKAKKIKRATNNKQQPTANRIETIFNENERNVFRSCRWKQPTRVQLEEAHLARCERRAQSRESKAKITTTSKQRRSKRTCSRRSR